MSYKILEQNGIDNENVDGGAFNNFASGGRDGIVGGVLSECAVTAAGSAIGVSPGLIILHGIRVKVTGIETLSLSSVPLRPTSYQIVAQVTLASNGDVDFSFFIRTPQPLVQNSLYQNSAGTYQAELASFTHNPDGTISDLMKTLDVIYGSGGGDVNIEVGTVTTETLDAGLDADFDVSVRHEEGTNKILLDFDAKIPRGASGTDDEAVHFTPQALTEPQQTQAQQNMGIGLSYEQLEDGTYNLVIGLTGDGTDDAVVSQINENKINAAEAETAKNAETSTNAKNAETAENSPKSLYNLGTYDTYVDNGDGTVTVTRKTGRYNVPINDFVLDANNCFQQNITLPNTDKYFSVDSDPESGSEHATSNIYPLGKWGRDDTFYISPDNWLRVLDNSYSKDATGLAQFKASLEAAGGMYILYETDTSYPEKLPANVPLNTLDANMSDIVRDEVEKTLNLCQVKNPAVGSRIYIGTVSAGTYSICLNESPANNIGYQFQLFPNPSTTEPIFTDNVISTKTTFTVTETTDLYIYVNGKVGTFSVMLNAGSNIYPYQPYNGAIVHEIRTPLYFSTDNVSPASIDQIGGNWTSLGSFMVGRNTIYAWKKA